MKIKDWLVFIGLSIAWGSSFLWIKIALDEIGPFLLVALRLFIGAIAMLIYFLIKRPELPKQTSIWKSLIIIGLINTAIPFVLISWGEQFIASAMASILNGSVPLFTAVIAHFYLTDDRLTTTRILGLFVGFAGVVVLVTQDVSGGISGSFLGQAAVLLAALLYGISSVYIRRNTVEISPIVRALIPLITADAFVWLSATLVESPLQIPQLSLTWISLLWLGIIGSFLAYLMYYYLLHSVGPTRATMITFTFPLVGLILGVVFLQESLTPSLLLGAGLIVGSIAMVNR